MEEIKEKIKPCDIILRRYHRYLDGIIFSENSYFTHVGICYKEDDKPFQVLHATGKRGVDMSDLDEFCKCDNLAILRFSLEETEEERIIRDYIVSSDRTMDKDVNIMKEEEELFDYLMRKTKAEIAGSTFADNKSFSEHYSGIILKRALSLKGTPYDFDFNFNDFGTFSCIEYVWYCFKPLFPMHRIRVKDFEFFGMLKMPVIIPDVFIKNDFFSYVYSSLPGIEANKHLLDDNRDLRKMELKKFIKKGSRQFLPFIVSIFLWNLLILVIYQHYRNIFKFEHFHRLAFF